MNYHNVKLILASQSPRRRQLLKDAGFEFSVDAPDDAVERGVQDGLAPHDLVVESALVKARHVAEKTQLGVVLAADTVAECNGQVLGKPESKEDAKRMLMLMSGETHAVLTGVCLWHRPSDCHLSFLESTTLRMDKLVESELDSHLESGDWKGKAGGFGFQDGLDWVHIEKGLASNVVGLPVEKLAGYLDQLLKDVEESQND